MSPKQEAEPAATPREGKEGKEGGATRVGGGGLSKVERRMTSGLEGVNMAVHGAPCDPAAALPGLVLGGGTAVVCVVKEEEESAWTGFA